VKFWNAATGQELTTLSDHERPVLAVGFSPDGKLLASASLDNTAILWDAASGRRLYRVSGHNDGLDDLAFSPDGKWLATASIDRLVKLWSVDMGRELLTFPGHTDGVIAVAFSPNGNYLLSASGDRTARRYVLDIAELMALARARLSRSLTPEECEKYLHRTACSKTTEALQKFVDGKQRAEQGNVEKAIALMREAQEAARAWLSSLKRKPNGWLRPATLQMGRCQRQKA